MITNAEAIDNILSSTDNIFCYEFGTDDVILLVKDGDKLVRGSPFGGLAYKPISDIKQITFDYDLKAWEVVWKQVETIKNS